MNGKNTVRSMLTRVGQINELSEVTTFTGYRNGKRVTVRLLDLGPDCDNPTNRFACEVEQEDGKKAMGNNTSDPVAAVHIVHWSELD